MSHGIAIAAFLLMFLPATTAAAPSCGDPDASLTGAATDALIILKNAVGQPVMR